ncbi:MAG TPA: hypothetical protein VFW44_10380, partial [Bryobacteraceae bacterium]|nr:hypothetical protein [Bryobacteraceae bacterium]
FRFDTIWIWENVAIGLGVLAIGFWLAKYLGSRFANTTLVRRFVRDLGGYNLNAATRFLDTLEEFEGDYSPQERSSIREYSPDE